MRSFSTFEKEILRYLATTDEFVTMQLIYKFCGATIIEWNEKHTEIRLYGNEGEERATRQNLFDVIALLSYLEKEGIIFVSSAPLNKDRLIYNRKTLNLQKRDDGYYDVWTKLGAIKEQPNISAYLDNAILKERSGLGETLDYYANSTYHVTETLRDFVRKDFKTEEQVRFRKSYIQNWIAIGIAFFVGISSIIISCTK